MYGSVSRVLQTRKTIKIAWCFRKFHYNRDSNTNEHLSISLDFSASWRQIIRALKTTSRKNYCELEGPLEMVGDRRVAPTSHRISWPETHGATCRMSWRGVVICSWNVPNQFVLEHTFLNGIISHDRLVTHAYSPAPEMNPVENCRETRLRGSPPRS